MRGNAEFLTASPLLARDRNSGKTSSCLTPDAISENRSDCIRLKNQITAPRSSKHQLFQAVIACKSGHRPTITQYLAESGLCHFPSSDHIFRNDFTKLTHHSRIANTHPLPLSNLFLGFTRIRPISSTLTPFFFDSRFSPVFGSFSLTETPSSWSQQRLRILCYFSPIHL